jgi:hypothetical protein
MEGWTRFEQRARERRIEKCLAAAHAALLARRFKDCRAALAELGELNPAHPDLERLQLQLTRAETSHRPRSGAFAVAVAAFAAVMFAASWVGNSKLLRSSSSVESTTPAPVAETLRAASDIVVDVPMVTKGEPETVSSEIVAAEPPAPQAVAPEASTALTPPALMPPAGRPAAPTITPSIPTPPVPAATARPSESLVPVPAAVPTELGLPASSAIGQTVILPTPSPEHIAPAPEPPVTAAIPAAAAPVDAAPAPVVDDAARVRSVVEKYQAAYDRLDAGLVHDVWPGVNEAALARAFEGLQSQTLTFRACDVQLRGSAATVLCTGSTRYVPKIGSREPHVETLAWTFTLRKRANDQWQIESARAER